MRLSTHSQSGDIPPEHGGSFPRSRVLPIRSQHPGEADGGEHRTPISSFLTTMLRKQSSEPRTGNSHQFGGLLGAYDERDPLLPKHDQPARTQYVHRPSSDEDLEHQRQHLSNSSGSHWPHKRLGLLGRFRVGKPWSRQEIWKRAVLDPASYLPPVILGLLLNVLDGLSYGKSWPATQ